jgi:ribonuclease D
MAKQVALEVDLIPVGADRIPVTPEFWERQAREPAKAFHAFAHYRDLGASRSLDKAFRQHKTSCDKVPVDAKTRAPKQWDIWNKVYQWQWRIQQWDAHLDKDTRELIAKDVCEIRARHARTAQAALTTLILPARAILDVLQQHPETIHELAAAAAADQRLLLSLVGYATRAALAMGGITNVERLARGVGPDAKEEVTVDNARRRILQLLEYPEATLQAIQARVR